jgi:hypothetical protein
MLPCCVANFGSQAPRSLVVCSHAQCPLVRLCQSFFPIYFDVSGLLGRRVSLSGSSLPGLSSPLGSNSASSLPLPASLVSPLAGGYGALSGGSGPGSVRSPFFASAPPATLAPAVATLGSPPPPLVICSPHPQQLEALAGGKGGSMVASCGWEEGVEGEEGEGGAVILPANQDIPVPGLASTRLDSCGGSSSRRASEAFVRTVSSSSGGSSEGDALLVVSTP